MKQYNSKDRGKKTMYKMQFIINTHFRIMVTPGEKKREVHSIGRGLWGTLSYGDNLFPKLSSRCRFICAVSFIILWILVILM